MTPSCPYCGYTIIRYSQYEILHAIRFLVGSRKRYCPNCEKKWRLRTRSRKDTTARDTILFAVFIAGAFLFFHGINSIDFRAMQTKAAMAPTAMVADMMKERMKNGSAGDMQNLSPEQKKMLKKMISQYGQTSH